MTLNVDLLSFYWLLTCLTAHFLQFLLPKVFSFSLTWKCISVLWEISWIHCIIYQKKQYQINIVSSPPWDQGGWFLCHQPGRGATTKLQEPGWGHIQEGEMILGSQAGGELLYHDELLVFPQNASPWILQILPVALSYIFLTFS